MELIVLDFESHYDKDYSLSKITTEQYIRDPRFEAIGVSVRQGGEDGVTHWVSGTTAQIKRFLDSFPWDNAVAVAHNAMFDMAILNWVFDIRPKRIADTLSMARAVHGSDGGSLSLAALAERYDLGRKGHEVQNALGMRRLDFSKEQMERYGEYCCNDTELTYKLFCALAPQVPTAEARLIDLTLRMFTEPVLTLCKDTLKDHLEGVVAKKESLLSKALIDKENLMSNPKLAQTLLNLGVTPPMKISPTTGKPCYAFAKSDEEFKELLEHDNIIVQAIVAARLGVKSTLEETRTERFIQIAERGPLPIPLRYYAAHTGRWGGDDKVNMQNIPRGSPLKRAIKAPEGYLFVDCDSSQIEARTLAWLAGQMDLVEAFERGEDVYSIMASVIYSVPVEKVTKDQRFVGKTTILGCGYGMGPAKFRTQLKTFGVDLPEQECDRIIHVYRATYPRIPALWQQGRVLIEAMVNGQVAPFGREGILRVDEIGIKLPNGLHLKYPNLRQRANPDDGRMEYVYDTRKGRSVIPTRLYGGKLVENTSQALARIVIGEQMLMVARRYKVPMTVHDSVGVIIPEAEGDTGRAFVEDCMRMRPKWALGLPLNCESKMGATYGG